MSYKVTVLKLNLSFEGEKDELVALLRELFERLSAEFKPETISRMELEVGPQIDVQWGSGFVVDWEKRLQEGDLTYLEVIASVRDMFVTMAGFTEDPSKRAILMFGAKFVDKIIELSEELSEDELISILKMWIDNVKIKTETGDVEEDPETEEIAKKGDVANEMSYFI